MASPTPVRFVRAPVVWLCAAQFFCAGSPAWAQRAFTMHKVDAEVGGSFDGSWMVFPTGQNARRLDFREWVGLHLNGDVGGPRAFVFDARLRPTRLQVNSTGLTLESSFSDQVGSLDLNASAHLFPVSPVSLLGEAHRNSGTSPGSFGQRTDFKWSGWSTGLRWNQQFLPAELSYEDRSIFERVGSPQTLQQVTQDADIKTATLQAQNTKLWVFAEHVTYDDRVGLEDFVSTQGTLTHSLRWGKGSHLGSSLSAIERTGAGAYERRSWEETVRLQHTGWMVSDYRYSVLHTGAGGGTVDQKGGDVGLTARPLSQLELGLSAHVESNHFIGGSNNYSRWGPRGRYSAALPLRAQVSVGGSAGWERVDQQVSGDGRIPVANERHVVPPSGRFLLENGNVELGSVLLKNVTETITYQSGFDYQLFQSGTLVEVLVLPAGRIAVGDTVLVDYTFLLLPSVKTDAFIAQFDASLGWGGLTVYHQRAKRSGAESGSPGLGGVQVGSSFNIGNRDDRTTGVRGAWTIGRASLTMVGERQLLSTDEFSYQASVARGAFSVPVGRSLLGTVQGDWSLSKNNGFRREARLGSAGLDWYSQFGRVPFRLRGMVVAWRWDETGGNRQAFLGGMLDADLMVRQLSVRVRVDYNTWQWTYLDRESRVFFWLSRRF